MIKAEFNKDTKTMEVSIKGDQDVVSVELVALEAAIYKLITNKKTNDEQNKKACTESEEL